MSTSNPQQTEQNYSEERFTVTKEQTTGRLNNHFWLRMMICHSISSFEVSTEVQLRIIVFGNGSWSIVYSFGCFPGVWLLYADVLEPSIGSIYKGWKMEPIEGSETSAYNNQTPGKHPKEYIIDSKHGESLKSRMVLDVWKECGTSTLRIQCPWRMPLWIWSPWKWGQHVLLKHWELVKQQHIPQDWNHRW